MALDRVLSLVASVLWLLVVLGVTSGGRAAVELDEGSGPAAELQGNSPDMRIELC